MAKRYIMIHRNESHIDEETLRKAGLHLLEQPISEDLPPDARVYEFNQLKDVYIMENDLYGNPMPEGSCFLAFHGRAGLMGQHLKVETLRNCSTEEIKKIVESNNQG